MGRGSQTPSSVMPYSTTIRLSSFLPSPLATAVSLPYPFYCAFSPDAGVVSLLIVEASYGISGRADKHHTGTPALT